MKKTIFILLLSACSTFAFSQQKDSIKPEQIKVPDSIPVLTKADVIVLLKYLGQLKHDEVKHITYMIEEALFYTEKSYKAQHAATINQKKEQPKK
jgi:hypothetical protein